MSIYDQQTLRQYMASRDWNIVGAGVNVFNRMGLEAVVADYRLVAIRDTKDNARIRQDVDIHVLESEEAERPEKYNSYRAVCHPSAVEFIESKPGRPVILSYSHSSHIQRLADQRNWLYAMPSGDVARKLEHKPTFRALAKRIVPDHVPKSLTCSWDACTYDRLNKTFGERFVLQTPLLGNGGGNGTVFINGPDAMSDARAMMQEKVEEAEVPVEDTKGTVLATAFVEGVPVSTVGVATRWGTLASGPQVQIQDCPTLRAKDDRFGVFQGHDWSYTSHIINDQILKQVRQITKRMGEAIYDEGFAGFFGLDFLYNEQKNTLTILECNPRFTGVMPTFDFLQQKHDGITFAALHLLEHLERETSQINVDIERMQARVATRLSGAQFHLNGDNEDAYGRLHTSLQAGVYRHSDDKIAFLRPGYRPDHLEKDTFLLAEFPTDKARVFKRGRVSRVITDQRVLVSQNRMNERGKEIVRALEGKLIVRL